MRRAPIAATPSCSRRAASRAGRPSTSKAYVRAGAPPALRALAAGLCRAGQVLRSQLLPSSARPMTTATHPIRISKIGHVGLYCRDLPRMVEFYTRVLGFKVSDVNEKGMTFLRFGTENHSFVLAPAPQGATPSGSTVLQQIAMEVADLDTLK